MAQINDPTIAPPPKPVYFLQRTFHDDTARHEEKSVAKKKFSHISLFAKGYRTMASGSQGAPNFRKYNPKLVSKPAISLYKMLGGLPQNGSDVGDGHQRVGGPTYIARHGGHHMIFSASASTS